MNVKEIWITSGEGKTDQILYLAPEISSLVRQKIQDESPWLTTLAETLLEKASVSNSDYFQNQNKSMLKPGE